jgi:hypothetical protein
MSGPPPEWLKNSPFFWQLKFFFFKEKNYTWSVHIANIWRNIAFYTRINTINAIPRSCKKLLLWSQSDPKMAQGRPKVHQNGPRIPPKNTSKTQGYPKRPSERPPKNAKETKVSQAWAQGHRKRWKWIKTSQKKQKLTQHHCWPMKIIENCLAKLILKPIYNKMQPKMWKLKHRSQKRRTCTNANEPETRGRLDTDDENTRTSNHTKIQKSWKTKHPPTPSASQREHLFRFFRT